MRCRRNEGSAVIIHNSAAAATNCRFRSGRPRSLVVAIGTDYFRQGLARCGLNRQYMTHIVCYCHGSNRSRCRRLTSMTEGAAGVWAGAAMLTNGRPMVSARIPANKSPVAEAIRLTPRRKLYVIMMTPRAFGPPPQSQIRPPTALEAFATAQTGWLRNVQTPQPADERDSQPPSGSATLWV